MHTDRIHVRYLSRHSDYSQAVELQKKAWQFSDVDVTPPHILRVLSDSRYGLCCGAFIDDALIGLVVAFATLEPGLGLIHQIAVDPGFQNQGIFGRLLLFVLQQKDILHVGKVISTFDPFVIKNAHLYMKTGAVGIEYLENYYFFDSEHQQRFAGHLDRLKLIWVADDLLKPKKYNPEAERAEIQFPVDLEIMEQREPEKAEAVMREVREQFRVYMTGKKFSLVDFVIDENRNTCTYILEKR